MSKKRIFTVGFVLPGDDFEYIPFDSDQTLLDADIILFEPSLSYQYGSESHNGKTLLSKHDSFETKETLGHWYSEIVSAYSAGKLVIIYLVKPIEIFRYTGDKTFSGTGRSRVTTNIVTEISSYESVPQLNTAVAKSGKHIRIETNATYIKPYWKEFSCYSPYQVHIEGDFTDILLKTHSGNRIVGAACHTKSGTLLFLPPLQYDKEEFDEYDEKTEEEFWTEKGLTFGAKLATTLSNLFDTLHKSNQVTPPPTWALGSEYRLAAESEYEKQISTLSSKMAKLQEKKSTLASKLLEAGNLRRLLYEQGKPLEEALLEALTLFGFKAEPFADGESEFDAVIISPEGRCIGEVEGKDNKSINIDKMSQLERNLQEDFAREEVDDFAKGVLFGNAYRLTSVAEREEFFTTKCISAAKRAKIALVRTPDIFMPAKYLKQYPKDKKYAKQCRNAIFGTEGEIVIFPSLPIQEDDILIESTPSQ